MELEKDLVLNKIHCIKEKTLLNLLYTSNWVNSNLKSRFDPFNTTVQQYNILRILRDQSNKPATINLLKDRMLDKMSDASRIVERLVQKALVQRTICCNDRRAVDISLTEAGHSLLDTLDKNYAAEDVIGARLNELELRQLNLYLDRLRD